MNKKLFKKAVCKIIAPCIATAFLYIGTLGLSNLFNNKHYINEEQQVISRADGILGRVTYRVARDKSLTEVRKDNYFTGQGCIDIFDGASFGKCDGLVDKVFIFGSSRINGVLTRSIDYSRFKDEFDKADMLLSQTKKRFGNYN